MKLILVLVIVHVSLIFFGELVATLGATFYLPQTNNEELICCFMCHVICQLAICLVFSKLVALGLSCSLKYPTNFKSNIIMGTEVENNRPNIRIQIVNNVAEGADEKMDVDVEQNENEEGEISDDKDNEEMSENVEPTSSTKVKLCCLSTIVDAYRIGIF